MPAGSCWASPITTATADRARRGAGGRRYLSRETLYERTGLQFLPLNTIYQLAASVGSPELDARPDAADAGPHRHWLTGEQVAERTNASTTGLFDIRARRLGVGPGRLVGVRAPASSRRSQSPASSSARSTVAGEDRPAGAGGAHARRSHDTASAVVGVPARGRRSAYISCGTWGLVGVELERPGPAPKRAARRTSPTRRGVDGRVRFLRNVMGLWLLDESLRTWERQGTPVDARRRPGAPRPPSRRWPDIDPNDPAFVPPGDMPARIVDACRAAGRPGAR